MAKIPADPGWMGDIRRGAGLGRAQNGVPSAEMRKFTLRKIAINSGGYDSGGAYWGIGQPLYWASCDEIDRWFRASNRQAAKETIRKEFPNARFFN